MMASQTLSDALLPALGGGSVPCSRVRERALRRKEPRFLLSSLLLCAAVYFRQYGRVALYFMTRVVAPVAPICPFDRHWLFPEHVFHFRPCEGPRTCAVSAPPRPRGRGPPREEPWSCGERIMALRGPEPGARGVLAAARVACPSRRTGRGNVLATPVSVSIGPSVSCVLKTEFTRLPLMPVPQNRARLSLSRVLIYDASLRHWEAGFGWNFGVLLIRAVPRCS